MPFLACPALLCAGEALRRSEPCERYRRSPQQRRIPPYKAPPKRIMRTIPAESATEADSALQGFAEANHAIDTGGVRPTRLDAVEDMKLFNFFRKINHSPSLSSAVNLNEDVGRNAPHLRTPPLLCGTAQDLSVQRFGCTWQYATAQGGRSAFCSVRGWGRVLQFCVIIFLLFLPFSTVMAQTPSTRLFFEPMPLVLSLSDSAGGVVTLEVADGVDIFAFDLFVEYDAALLSVSEVEVGDFLGEGLVCMDQVNTPGLVHYSCTRWGVDYGVSGSGVLLSLTFEALGIAGESSLSLGESELYDWPEDQPVVDGREDGRVVVEPFRVFLPLMIRAAGQGMGAGR